MARLECARQGCCPGVPATTRLVAVAGAARAVSKGELAMPVLFIEAPPGTRPEARRKTVQKLTEAIDGAYHIGAR